MQKLLLTLILFSFYHLNAQTTTKLNFSEFALNVDQESAATFSTSEAHPKLSKLQIISKAAVCGLNNGEIVINFNQFNGVRLILSDLKGNVLRETTMTNAEFIFDQLKVGEYLLSTITADGNKTIDLINVREKKVLPQTIFLSDGNSYRSGSSIEAQIETLDSVELKWNMGDGTIIYNQNQVKHTYKSGGKYTISIEAGNWDCETVITTEVEIFDLANSLHSDY